MIKKEHFDVVNCIYGLLKSCDNRNYNLLLGEGGLDWSGSLVFLRG